MSDSHQQSRRRRWGDRSAAGPLPPPVAAAARATVSDQDALQALLADAHAKEREKEEQRRQQASRDKRPAAESSRNGSKRPRRDDDSKNKPNDSYYGPQKSDRDPKTVGEEGGNKLDEDADNEAVDKQKPNFGLSGALAKDTKGGNMYKGVLLKFQEPPEARAPNTAWRLYVYKGEEQTDILHIAKQSAYLLGRLTDICDIPLAHPSCSSQHAVLQYRALPRKDDQNRLACQPYLMDLESTNGSFLNGVRIDSARYYQLKKGDVLRFGASTREYVLLTANTKSI